MKAIVLAAGRGEGLLPFTEGEQKESISLLGKSIISYSLEGLKKAGIKEAVVIINDRGVQIDVDLPIELVRQKTPGITGAVRDGMEKIDDDYFVLTFGDIVSPPEFYINLMNAYAVNGEAVFSLVPVNEGIQTYGLARIRNEKLEIVKDGESTLALGGAYVLPRGDFDDLLEYLSRISEKAKYFIWSGEWADIGYPEDLINAVEMMLRNRKTIIGDSLISRTAVIGKAIIEDGAIIDDFADIKGPAYIGKNAYIGSFSLIRDYSSIETGAQVGAYCEVSHSLIQPKAIIGSKSYLTYSVIGREANIGSSVITANYPAKTSRGKVNKLGALISPWKEIKHGSVLEPGYKV
ncbi:MULTISPECIES: sugar phosphate nucleotidyltransferase [Acidianus]|uniref:Nucleotidyltransferase n=1 Tax=Candidatus Acidianus copahuensis TaxID=1160895 RepID=A0A031LM88_9CREN|nr:MULTISPECIES: NDP-sugar synthase [Acidianus]EZQ06763.1 nucleotidyltransferase [Candidatus Acidianus copahuensis]NON61266.1 NDP-sugar synthase [Acidianus sp. RZ1]